MKKKNFFDKKEYPPHSLSKELEEELYTFIVRQSNSIIADENENVQRSLSSESEYPTVNYGFPLSKKKKRILLQNLLDRYFLREGNFLYFAEWLVLEDLTSRIREEDTKEKLSEEDILWYNETLSLTNWILKEVSLKAKSFMKPGNGLSKQTILGAVENFLSFKVSDERTFRSRLDSYLPEKIIRFTVGIPLIQRERTNTKRYSSYTKGYGESHMKKISTPVDWEIDGEDIHNFDESQSLEPTIDFQAYLDNYILTLNSLPGDDAKRLEDNLGDLSL